MIHPDTLSPVWFSQTAKRLPNCDKGLLEKSIRALILVEQLAKSGLPFIFKGGSSLMLFRPIPLRFSIDIDIILPEISQAEIEVYLNEVISPQADGWPGFLYWEWSERKQIGFMNKGHAKFFYQPMVPNKADRDYILLDLLYEKSPYVHLASLEVKSELIQYDSQLRYPVSVPSIDDLFGDKLTAFAPKTTEIPYGVGKELEIIKQLYDLANLFDDVSDLGVVQAVFAKIAQDQVRYRDLEGTTTLDVCRDTLQTSLCLCTRGRLGDGDFDALQKGIKSFSNYTWEGKFHLEKAIIAAAKVAYITTKVLSGEKQFERFEEARQVAEFMIEDQTLGRLNKLKKNAPEAFFYWYLLLKTLEEHNWLRTIFPLP